MRAGRSLYLSVTPSPSLQYAGTKLLLPLREGLKDEVKFVCALKRASYVLVEDMEAFLGSDVYFSPLSFYLIGP